MGSQRHPSSRNPPWVNRDPSYSHRDSHKYTKNHRRELLLFLRFSPISLKSQVKQIQALHLLFFPFLGIHKGFPRLAQKPELLSLGFTQISLRSQDKQIWALHVRFFLSLGIHKDIPGLTQKPELLSLGFTQISLRSQEKKTGLFSRLIRDSQAYP